MTASSPSVSASLREGGFDLLLCNGAHPGIRLVRRIRGHADRLVCADGGANIAARCGLTPEIIIGDMDSIRPEVRRAYQDKGVSIRVVRRQTDTDLEKALLHLRARGCRRIVVLGATGDLLDHTLGNLSVLTRHATAMVITLVDPDYRIDVLTGDAAFASDRNCRISLIPLTACEGVTTHGLQYPLHDGRLVPGIAEGTSNKALGRSFSVRVESGILMVMRPISFIF